MCSLNNPVVAAARSLADAHHDLANAVCDATPQQGAAAVKQLKARGDTRALAFLQVVLARRGRGRTNGNPLAQLSAGLLAPGRGGLDLDSGDGTMGTEEVISGR